MRKIILLLIVLVADRLVAQPVITNQPANQPVVWGGNATFSVVAGSVGALIYQWQLNGTNLPNNIISTMVGNVWLDGAAATNTTFSAPFGTVVDAAGNLYVADRNNNVVRRTGTNGISKIIAGIGVSAFGGDGGPATNAFLSQPSAVIFDTNGNLYISDSNNNRVRKVDTNGIISTVAGNGAQFPPAGSGTATSVAINFPIGLALDKAGNLYIADNGNFCVRKVSPAGSLTTVAGQVGTPGSSGDGFPATSALLNGVIGVAVDNSGNIYIADSGNNRIRKVNTFGTISTIAGTGTAGYSGDGGSATLAKLYAPAGLYVDIYSNILIADTGNQYIRKITNGIIVAVAGNGVAGFSGDGGAALSANVCFPRTVSVDKSGNLYVADYSNRVRMVGTNGTIMTVAGKALDDGDWATNSTLNAPASVAQDRAGNLYIADLQNERVRMIDTNGVISTFAGNGIPGFAGDGGPATNASLSAPCGVALDAFGNLLIADQGNFRVRRVDGNGHITTVAGKGAPAFSGDGGAATNAGINPFALAADASGNLFIADSSNFRIRKVDTNGIITTAAGNGSFAYPGDGGAATNAGILNPQGVAVDPLGNLFIGFNGRVARVDTSGNIHTVAGNGTSGYSGDGGPATNAAFLGPYGLALDPAGNVFVSDLGDACVRKVGTNGIVTTIVGTGTRGTPSDNVPAAGTSLDYPRGICLDSHGNLLITDAGVNRLRTISYLEYADQPAFSITNVTSDSLSNGYSVVVANSSGSVTSSVANVILQLPPVVPAFTTAAGTVAFSWPAISNLTYQLQYTTNLTSPIWQNIGGPITATNSSGSASDSAGTDAQRFYRVQWVR